MIGFDYSNAWCRQCICAKHYNDRELKSCETYYSMSISGVWRTIKQRIYSNWAVQYTCMTSTWCTTKKKQRKKTYMPRYVHMIRIPGVLLLTVYWPERYLLAHRCISIRTLQYVLVVSSVGLSCTFLIAESKLLEEVLIIGLQIFPVQISWIGGGMINTLLVHVYIHTVKADLKATGIIQYFSRQDINHLLIVWLDDWFICCLT